MRGLSVVMGLLSPAFRLGSVVAGITTALFVRVSRAIVNAGAGDGSVPVFLGGPERTSGPAEVNIGWKPAGSSHLKGCPDKRAHSAAVATDTPAPGSNCLGPAAGCHRAV